MRNRTINGTDEVQIIVKAVRHRLPPGWSVDLCLRHTKYVLVFRATDARRAELDILWRKQVNPREVPPLLAQRENKSAGLIVAAPFLSERARELLAKEGMSYADTTGNLRVVVSVPAVFIESRGEDRNPERQLRQLRSLKGAAAARVVRALCDFKPPYGVRDLANISDTPLGTVSRVVSLLDEEALLTRDKKKQITSIDWKALITRWVRDYGVQTSNRALPYLEPRGLPALTSKLSKLSRYAVTGSMAGPSVAPARLAMVYVDSAESAARTLGLVPAEAGANVWLLEPYDEVVFERTQTRLIDQAPKAVTIVTSATSQVAADLMTSPGRGPQDAEALLRKMKGNENAWRRKPRT